MKEKAAGYLKFLLLFVLFVILLGLPAMASAAPAYPDLQQGSVGEPVAALQYLLRGWVNSSLGIDGSFGPRTQAAVMQFQKDQGLAVDGIVGPHTWSVLLPTLGLGDQGEGVKGLQALLNGKLKSNLVVDGAFGAKTQGALIQYQKNQGLSPDGILGPYTWGQLLTKATASKPYPGTGFVQLPAAGPGFERFSDGDRTWGRPDVIQTLMAVGQQWAKRHPEVPPISIGDISAPQGGYFPPHASHQEGRDADFGTMVDQNNNYSATLTQELVDILWATGKIEIIFFNDPQVGGVTYWPGHDDHLHVRFLK